MKYWKKLHFYYQSGGVQHHPVYSLSNYHPPMLPDYILSSYQGQHWLETKNSPTYKEQNRNRVLIVAQIQALIISAGYHVQVCHQMPLKGLTIFCDGNTYNKNTNLLEPLITS